MTEFFGALFQSVLDAERALSALDGAASQLPNPHLLIGPFLRREAKLSSAIENTFASAEQLALFEFDPTSVENRDEVREVFNYVRALEHGLQSELPICLRLIKEMHKILLDGVRRSAGRPGAFRTIQNAIMREGDGFTRAKFVPPPPALVEGCLAHLERFIHAESQIPRLVRFALVHYQFETIHPFDDGNGRLGRLLITLQLCKQAQMSKPLVYVSGYFEQHRSQYTDLLYGVSTRGEWYEWIRFFLEAIRSQAEDALGRAKRLWALRDDYQARVREKRASALLPQIVDQLFLRPSLTIAEVRRLADINANTASAIVNRLCDKGILHEATGRKRDRIFVATKILEIIEEPGVS